MKRLTTGLALAGLLSTTALGQAVLTTTNVSGTIAVTNTFQSIDAANPSRQGCSIQNNGANAMYVFFGPIASATKAKSVVLAAGTGGVAGQAVSCNLPGVRLGDQISITGTATDAFYAGIQ